MDTVDLCRTCRHAATITTASGNILPNPCGLSFTLSFKDLQRLSRNVHLSEWARKGRIDGKEESTTTHCHEHT